MAKSIPTIGEIDPARLYPGPTIDAIFAIDPSTRWRWIKNGRLTAYYPGGEGSPPRFKGSDILDLIDRSRVMDARGADRWHRVRETGATS